MTDNTTQLLLGEELLPLAEAFEKATGRRPSAASIARWRLRGIRGTRLESVRLGGRWLSSTCAVHRFIAACSSPITGESEPQPSRQRRMHDAERRLSDRGV